ATKPSRLRLGVGFVVALVLGIYGGLFSGGYTTLMTALVVATMGVSLMEAVALTKPVNTVSCSAASLVFWLGGLIDLRVGVPLAIANFIGGWLGANIAVQAGERVVR